MEMSKGARTTVAIGAFLGLTGVIAGAAGTHALENTLDADSLDTFETAVRFQMYHALALLLVGFLADRRKSRLFQLVGLLFVGGVVLFSGSLYLLAVTDVGAFGAVAPVGGVGLILGWATLALSALRR